MAQHVIYSQWGESLPDFGHKLLGPNNRDLRQDPLDDVTVYIPKYMAGPSAYKAFARMPNLKLVQLPSAGFEDALDFLPEGVTLCNAAGVHTQSTAELALALTLASLRGLDRFVINQQTGSWGHESLASLADRRVLVVGFGDIGQKIAQMLEVFAAEVVPVSRSGRNGAHTIAELDGLLPTADVVILIVPATPETSGLIDGRRMRLMKPGALLVNVARGGVVVTDDLVQVLNEGHIAAALDVTDPEPLPVDHPLWRAPNVIISPHVGGDSTAFEPRMHSLLATQFERLAQDLPPLHRVAGPGL
jgi:phosphoglycerate dehydrogenase-like enzyme